MTGTSLGKRKKGLARISDILPAVLAASAILIAGCAGKKAHAIAWATAIRVRPTPPAAPDKAKNVPDIAPDLRIEPPPPSEFAARRTSPVRPRVTTANTDEAENPANAPVLAPQLSPQELGFARQQTRDSLSIAERNLHAAQGHRLNALQSDLVSKIRSFAEEARKAAEEGDWTRARNLAKKAQVLSEELAGQL